MSDPISDALDAHFVTMHRYDDPAKPPGEWICSCGLKFGFSESVVGHQAEAVREALSSTGPVTGSVDHDFLPVAGHPDDDECTHRFDGTDATYCGLARADHDAY